MLRALAVALIVSLPVTLVAQKPPSVFTLKSVGPNVWAAIDAFGGGANAGFIVGDDGVAVADTLSYADAARHFLAAIRMRTTQPIRYVVDTHYHIDHVAGNGVFKDAGAMVMAQRKVRCWIHSENEHLTARTSRRRSRRWSTASSRRRTSTTTTSTGISGHGPYSYATCLDTRAPTPW